MLGDGGEGTRSSSAAAPLLRQPSFVALPDVRLERSSRLPRCLRPLMVMRESKGAGGGRRLSSGLKPFQRDLRRRNGPREVKELKRLMSFTSLDELLLTLENFYEHDKDEIPPQQAVAALNHLKRLKRIEASNRRAVELEEREATCFRFYAGIVERGISRLSAKHVALALNAVRERQGFESMFQLSDRRIRVLAQEALVDKSGKVELYFDSQNIANIVNAYASAGYVKQELFELLAQVTLAMKPTDFTPQSVANILNAFVRSGGWSKNLFEFLSLVTLGLDHADFSPQHVSNIVNAFAKAEIHDRLLFQKMSKVALGIPQEAYSMQAVANILGAFSHFNIEDVELFQHLANSLDSDMLGSEEDARGLRQDMTEARAMSSFREFGMATFANIIKSLGKVKYRDFKLFKYFTSVILSSPSNLFDAKTIADIVSSWVVYAEASLQQKQKGLEEQDDELLRHMCSLALSLCIRTNGPKCIADAVLMLPAFSKCLEVSAGARLQVKNGKGGERGGGAEGGGDAGKGREKGKVICGGRGQRFTGSKNC
eukprot:29512-Hanusia_phi.AAC.1